ncbi:MAG: ribosome rescue protein RqcH [Candidatus Poseidoniaceae archaeon]|jgi:predicted ribosome quality control (RQC) complex YloA/Tae2 family protein|nr:ribosome rescue protein RqcH [Candidatus Poseidoniaceae archaeon]
MREQMSGFDLRRMSLELQAQVGGWMKKAYQPHHEQVVLRINPKEGSQQDLVIVRGKRIYLSSRDRPMPAQPSPFAMLLRKHLGNARLEKVEQHGFDRILVLSFNSRGGPRHLVIECFRDGNIILTDESHTIIQPLTHATYAGRTLKRGEPYRFPPEASDPHELNEAKMGELLSNSERDLVRTLAGQANLGRVYARAICADSGIDETTAANEVGSKPTKVAKICESLTKMLNELSSEHLSWLILEEGSEKEYEDIEPGDSINRDIFLSEKVVEATPILLPEHQGLTTIEMPSMTAAADAWKGAHDAMALARRETEQTSVSVRGGLIGTKAERMERRLEQQEKALESFDSEVERMQTLGHAITDAWMHVDGILVQTREAVERVGWDEVSAQLDKTKWLKSCDPARRTLEMVLPDHMNSARGPVVEVYLDDTVHQNAQRWFEKARKQKEKSVGARQALIATRKELEKARKVEKAIEEGGKVAGIRRSRRLWFENHRWTILDGNHLMVAGRDAKGNDMLVKKHLRSDDRYVHADLHGAASGIMKMKAGFINDEHPPSNLPEGVPAFRLVDDIGIEEFSEEAQTQAASLALAWSRAWNAGRAGGAVFWVKPGQVSKSAETGEFVGKGSFVIRGKRNWMRDVPLELALGLVCINTVPLLMCGTVNGVSAICQRWAIIRPGREKKEMLANRIAKATGLTTDDVLPVIPGQSEIAEDHGLIK